MIDPTVRPATPADATQLEELEDEARDFLAGQRGGARWLADHPRAAWAAPDAIVHVAHMGDLIVGYMIATVTGPLALIESVYVTPEARQLGFGDGLLEATIDVARRLGATTLDGETLPGDRDVKNLYERAGIKARLITVSTPL